MTTSGDTISIVRISAASRSFQGPNRPQTFHVITRSVVAISSPYGRSGETPPLMQNGRVRRSRQRERDHVITQLRLQGGVAARRDDHELLPVRSELVGHRGGLCARGQVGAPQLAAGLDIEGAQVR